MYIDAHFHCNAYMRYENALERALGLLERHGILVVSSSTEPESARAREEWDRSHAAVEKLPSDRLLVETDGPCRTEPYPPPDAPRSMPTYLFDVIAEIAEIREAAPEELVRSTNQNFKQLIEDDEHLIPYYNLI